MKIAILHQDLEWAEKTMADMLTALGNIVTFADIASTTPAELTAQDLVLNRVYASVANRNSRDNLVTLELLASAETHGVKCINSYSTTLADYSKAHAADVMTRAGVVTPATMKLRDAPISEALEFAENFLYPVIVKRDMGGRGKDIAKADNPMALENAIATFYKRAEEENYYGGFIVQEFVPSMANHDCRIAVVDGKFAFAYGRTLISETPEEKPWLASISKGSQFVEDFIPPTDAVEMALKATESIGAVFNTVDLAFSERGPVIIENNATPNYDHRGLRRLQVASSLINDYARASTDDYAVNI